MTVAPDMTVTIDDIRRAAANIDGQVVRTACTRSRVLSKLTGAEVWLKFENFQFCLLYTSPSPRDKRQSRMPSSA